MHCAGSIADSLRAAASTTPDLVVLDLSLPDGDGLELCSALRMRTSAYIVVLSARGDEADKLLAFRLGADDFMTKPFSTGELVARVDALFRRPRSRTTTTTIRMIGGATITPVARTCLVPERAW